jgi:hypothetical protein
MMACCGKPNWRARMSSTLNLTLSEFSAGLWAKRGGIEQTVHDLEALGRSLEAIEPFASLELGRKNEFGWNSDGL